VIREGLGEHGSVEGQIVLSEWRAADGRRDRAASLARELAQRNVAFIVVGRTPAAQTRMRPAPIPIAMAPAGDPIGSGFAASLARPGRNITGITGIGAELSGKQLEAFRQLVPKLTRRAADQFLWGAFSKSMIEQTRVAAKSSGTFVQVVSVSASRRAGMGL
jgi:putative ABC transport system substrate-binding protein